MAMTATIPSVSGIPCRVGIVTYDTAKNAENAVGDLQGTLKNSKYGTNQLLQLCTVRTETSLITESERSGN